MIKNLKNRKIWLFITLTAVIFIYHFNFKVMPETDDGWFSKVPAQFSLFGYLKWRYLNWSGRLFPETILYYLFHVPVTIWRLVNSLFIVLLSYSVVRIYKDKVTLYNMATVIAIIGYISFNVIDSGFFWMTGSVNYLWPISIGLFIFIPYADSFFRDNAVNLSPINVIRIFLAIIFSLSNEQVLLCGIGVAASYHLAMFIKKKRFSLILFINTCIMFIGFFTMLVAPGNANRLKEEIHAWYPNFNDLSILGHLRIGTYWLFEQLTINFLPVFILIGILSLILMEDNKLKRIFILFSVSVILINFTNPGSLHNFSLIQQNDFSEILFTSQMFSKAVLVSLFPYVIWGMFFIGIIACSLTVVENRVFIALCYLAGLLSCVILFFSPTIYVSGLRVFNCLGIFLTIIIFNLINSILKLKNNNSKDENYALLLMSIYPFLNLINK